MGYHDEMVATVLYVERDGAEARERRVIPVGLSRDDVPGQTGRQCWSLRVLDVADNTYHQIPLSGIIKFEEHG
jgi:hypothetical protein